MKVSVALHHAEPGENQRENGAFYGGYNHQYAELIDDEASGAASCEIGVKFPPLLTDPVTATHFSIAVCEDVPLGYGGHIVIAGPLDPPVEILEGHETQLNAACVVTAERMAEVRAHIAQLWKDHPADGS